MIDPRTVNDIREAYVADLDLDREPSIPELCRQFNASDEASIKYIRRAASKENWEARRRVRANKVNTELEKRETALVKKIADELMVKREEFLRKEIADVETLLPQALSELEARIQSGFFDDKALVQAVKLLFDMRKHAIDTIHNDFKHNDDKHERHVDREIGLLKDLGLLSKVADAIEGKLTATTLEEGEYAVISELDQREAEALRVLDAEVPN